MNKRIYSVSQVNTYIKNMFAQDFLLRNICIGGEVSNCKYHSSGHVYFTLKDADGVLSAVMFAGMRRSGLTFPMKVGDKVFVTGEVRVFERDGKYQLYARQITPAGAGLLYQRFEELKKSLAEMGMFDAQYKRPIPKYAMQIGIVTAPTGAAVQDIQNIAKRRNPFVQLILYPAQVQGEGAAASIVNGIHALEQYGVDVMIVGRGGGSIEDLWAFNEEIVARAIFDCSVPVISAVGHETDTTIADYVADLRAPTPSAGAELAVFDIRQTMQQLEQMRFTLNRHLGERISRTEARVRQYELKLKLASPGHRLEEQLLRLADITERMDDCMKQLLVQKRHRLELLAAELESRSPLKTLQNGYAYLAGADGKRIVGVAGLKTGDVFTAYLSDGKVQAVVDKVEEKPH